ncbi:tRNA (guanine-N(7)-)-methyltransferase [Desulfosarcina ovata subsp. sediminis]|uniref:tRNA (guanine(46)-N(7))-methyltransferase n=1 Tax=Desulfosarcina ovata subsp. sediminis TaxID=885957 RepID=A0A5K7ZRJ0_9BACT|nr:tRNA (guanosine(46)-N7)-methyltransferase TrmB [Desulfosarcina ovata]BBO81793.1 tRNA (guanine-N(7)-)-methyltransferase [Desulfosarcina ovata subsp. sediminis]
MPKNKRQKHRRVKTLPNVTITESGATISSGPYPWNENRYDGMKRVLELGCGKGEHSLAFAAANPDALCVGVDRKSHRICVGAETAMAKGLDNVQFLRAPIECLAAFFANQSIHEIWLTFPDPHPKPRTSHLRLSAPRFLDTYAALLVPGGKVNLKTDSRLLFDYTHESVARCGGHVVVAADNLHKTDDGGIGAREVVSAFEYAARARGETIKYMAFELSGMEVT